jgi:hypothetical protein
MRVGSICQHAYYLITWCVLSFFQSYTFMLGVSASPGVRSMHTVSVTIPKVYCILYHLFVGVLRPGAMWAPAEDIHFPLQVADQKLAPLLKPMYDGKQGVKQVSAATVGAALQMAQALPYSVYAFWVVGYYI